MSLFCSEANVGKHTQYEFDEFIAEAFGPKPDGKQDIWFFREPRTPIVTSPNAIVSRFPLINAGTWQDSQATDRNFVWARLQISEKVELWVVSVHLLSQNKTSTVRNKEVQELIGFLQSHVPTDAFLLIGGDFNTKSEKEQCMQTLNQSGVVFLPSNIRSTNPKVPTQTPTPNVTCTTTGFCRTVHCKTTLSR